MMREKVAMAGRLYDFELCLILFGLSGRRRLRDLLPRWTDPKPVLGFDRAPAQPEGPKLCGSVY
jgi:hypothetical protein